MNDSIAPRVPAGVPTGGQFAASVHSESQVALDEHFDALYEELHDHADERASEINNLGPDGQREFLVRMGEKPEDVADLDEEALDDRVVDYTSRIASEAVNSGGDTDMIDRQVDGNQMYPNGRCDACGWGVDLYGRCSNDDCSRNEG